MMKENLELVEANIREACAAAGRDRSEVTLIAVSKTNPAERIREAYDLGVRDFGENKVKEMLGKEPQLPEDIRWHLIGHLQTNKVKSVIDKTVLIHSIDSIKLSDTIDFEARKKGIQVDGLLEVNVAGEESKFGFLPEELLPLLERLRQYRNLKIRGLMTVAPYECSFYGHDRRLSCSDRRGGYDGPRRHRHFRNETDWRIITWDSLEELWTVCV